MSEYLGGVDAQALTTTLEQLVRNVGELLAVPSVSVALLDSESGDLVTWAALGAGPEGPKRTRFRANEGIAGWVAAHLEPVIVSDVTGDARFKPLGNTSIRSMLCVPLIDQDQLLGTLTVSSHEVAAFDDRRRQLLQVFSDQAVLAISKTRQAEASKAYARELSALLDATRALTSSLDPSQVFELIVASTRKVITCDDVVIYAYQEHNDTLRVVTGMGPRLGRLGGAEISLDDPRSSAAWTAKHRRARVSSPGQGEIGQVTDMFLAGDELAILCVPLVSKGRLRGVIMLARHQSFLPGELGAMLNLSNIVAATLENAELYQTARAEREQQAAIYAAASDAIAVVDAALIIVEVNDAFARLAARPREQILGLTCCDALNTHQRVAECTCVLCDEESSLVRALQTGESVPHIECELPLAAGQVRTNTSQPRQQARRFVDFSVTPVHSPHGRRLLLVGRDVTAAREMDKMKSNFLSMVSHELRAPLQTITGYLDITLEGAGGPLTEKQVRFLSRARAGSAHLTAMVDDLLLVSRRDAGQFSLSFKEVDLVRSIREMVDELEVVARVADVELLVREPLSLPVIEADGPRLVQVLRNLLTNAIKFTPNGGTVTVSAEQAAERICVRVTDTGVGIAPQHLDKIFDRFFQVNPSPSNGRTHGQGLGLAIVRIIAEQHGGAVSVQSEPRRGSTFTVELPLRPPIPAPSSRP